MSDLLAVVIVTAAMLITVVSIALIAEHKARRAADEKRDRAARALVQSPRP